MSDAPPFNWLVRVPLEREVMRTDPLLVRLEGSGSRELERFLEDLIAWNAGARHHASAALEYIEAKNFPAAAKCALRISTAEAGRDRVCDLVSRS